MLKDLGVSDKQYNLGQTFFKLAFLSKFGEATEAHPTFPSQADKCFFVPQRLNFLRK